jgi:hypothetical protein
MSSSTSSTCPYTYGTVMVDGTIESDLCSRAEHHVIFVSFLTKVTPQTLGYLSLMLVDFSK